MIRIRPYLWVACQEHVLVSATGVTAHAFPRPRATQGTSIRKHAAACMHVCARAACLPRTLLYRSPKAGSPPSPGTPSPPAPPPSPSPPPPQFRFSELYHMSPRTLKRTCPHVSAARHTWRRQRCRRKKSNAFPDVRRGGVGVWECGQGGWGRCRVCVEALRSMCQAPCDAVGGSPAMGEKWVGVQCTMYNVMWVKQARVGIAGRHTARAC